jgi:hypothetical protein
MKESKVRKKLSVPLNRLPISLLKLLERKRTGQKAPLVKPLASRQVLLKKNSCSVPGDFT